MTRIVSARITRKMHEDLLDECNEKGCTINEFIEGLVENSLYDSADSKEKRKAEVKNWVIRDDNGNIIGRSRG